MLHGASAAQGLNLSGVLLPLGQIIGCLHPQPGFGIAAKGFLQAIAILAEIPALPLTKLFMACRVMPRKDATIVVISHF